MQTYISLLRGINVSGQKAIRMAELKQVYEALGFRRVTTYLQSGNVLFQAAEGETASLAAAIGAEIRRGWGFEVVVLIRTPLDLQRVVENNPFTRRQGDPAALYVTFLEQRPAEGQVSQVQTPTGETGEFAPAEQEVYLYCPVGYGRTKLSNTFFERKLKMPATTRSWKTVQALLEMAKDQGEVPSGSGV